MHRAGIAPEFFGVGVFFDEGLEFDGGGGEDEAIAFDIGVGEGVGIGLEHFIEMLGLQELHLEFCTELHFEDQVSWNNRGAIEITQLGGIEGVAFRKEIQIVVFAEFYESHLKERGGILLTKGEVVGVIFPFAEGPALIVVRFFFPDADQFFPEDRGLRCVERLE